MAAPEIRATLDRHWATSDADDFEAEHQIYQEDAVLEYPQSGEWRLEPRHCLRRGARVEQHAIGGAGRGCADDRVLRRDWRHKLPA